MFAGGGVDTRVIGRRSTARNRLANENTSNVAGPKNRTIFRTFLVKGLVGGSAKGIILCGIFWVRDARVFIHLHRPPYGARRVWWVLVCVCACVCVCARACVGLCDQYRPLEPADK